MRPCAARRLLCAALAALAFPASGIALASDAGSGAPISVRVSAQEGLEEVAGSFFVAAPRETAFAVLTDYGHMASFVTSLRRSQVRGHRGDGVVLEQEATARMLLFSKTMKVLLDVREEPGRALRFRDVSHADFESYEGSWTLEDAPGGTRVRYALCARPREAVPQFLLGPAMEKAAAELLAQVRDEIERRAR